MTVTTVINANTVSVPAGDIAGGTDYFVGLNAQGHVTTGTTPTIGATIAQTEKSWKLEVQKPTGFATGTKYLTIGVDYFYSSDSTWRPFWSNMPAGWTVDPNIDDDGSVTGTKGQQYTFDWATFVLGSLDDQGNLIGERPTKVRLHIEFSNGFTTSNILYQTANDFSLLM